MTPVYVLIAVGIVLGGLGIYHRNSPEKAVASRVWIRTSAIMLIAAAAVWFLFHK